MIRYANQNITEIDKSLVPAEVPIIPLRNAVVLPGVLLPIFVGRSESVDLVEAHSEPGQLIGLFTQKQPQDESINVDGLYRTGCLAEVHKVVPMSEGGYQVFLQGVQKIELMEITQSEPHLRGRVMPLGEIDEIGAELFQVLRAHVSRYIETHPGIPDEVNTFVKRLTNPSALANQVVFFSQKEIAEKIDFLRISSVAAKVEYVQEYLVEETNRIKMEEEVRNKVEKDTSKMQREFYLRKQMEQIRKELGETDEGDDDELEKQLAEKVLPEHVRKAVTKELKRLRRAQEGPQSGGLEVSQIRTWLELVAELPWEDPAPREINLSKAQSVLDNDHEGLEDVKKRIIEFLAVEKHTGGSKAPILCLVGPPGVGKTSLATSIASALGRPLVRAALGGVRDEAEIRGHRRTYVGSLPGKIISALKKAETRDPVFLLDEIDKTGASYQGDPAAALLEVLDPEQNHAFEDHYLAQAYDLSRVLFVCTANTTDTIPPALLDRMEVVHVSGYTLAEKMAIARKHLLPKILEQLKFEPESLKINDAALQTIVNAHTREAGVRTLKRKLESVARHAVRRLIEEAEAKASEGPTVEGSLDQVAGQVAAAAQTRTDFSVEYDIEDIRTILGRDRFQRDAKENSGIPGVAIGLAWTPVGGDILYIEATAYPGKGELKLSGQLGDVMKESALAAMSFLRAHADELDLDHEAFAKKDVHIHIPSGAIPKDGPSAGVTLLTALNSLFSGRPVLGDLAMTGEISLRGKILPVGGIKEKVLAARAADISTVFLPERNRPEFEEIPAHVREGLRVEYFSDMLELLHRTVPGRRAQPVVREGW